MYRPTEMFYLVLQGESLKACFPEIISPFTAVISDAVIRVNIKVTDARGNDGKNLNWSSKYNCAELRYNEIMKTSVSVRLLIMIINNS